MILLTPSDLGPVRQDGTHEPRNIQDGREQIKPFAERGRVFLVEDRGEVSHLRGDGQGEQASSGRLGPIHAAQDAD